MMETQTVPLQHHLPRAKLGHFLEIRQHRTSGKAGIFTNSSSSSVPLQTQVVEQPEPGLGHRLGVPCPHGRSVHGQGQSCSQLPVQPAMDQLSMEPRAAAIIPLTALGPFPACWTRLLSLQIGKNLQSSKSGFQRALQVIPQP